MGGAIYGRLRHTAVASLPYFTSKKTSQQTSSVTPLPQTIQSVPTTVNVILASETLYYVIQGQIQDFLRGGLNIEVISEAGGLGGAAPQKLQGVFVI